MTCPIWFWIIPRAWIWQNPSSRRSSETCSTSVQWNGDSRKLWISCWERYSTNTTSLRRLGQVSPEWMLYNVICTTRGTSRFFFLEFARFLQPTTYPPKALAKRESEYNATPKSRPRPCWHLSQSWDGLNSEVVLILRSSQSELPLYWLFQLPLPLALWPLQNSQTL